MRGSRIALLTAAVLFSGCTDELGPPPEVVHPTLIALEPSDFLGELSCGDDGGAQRYVVTLHDLDHEPDLEEPVARASGPVPCQQTVAFGNVNTEHHYVADVDVYDRTDIVPEGQPAGTDPRFGNGTAVMVDEAGLLVAPRWSTSCGRLAAGGSGGVRPIERWTVYLRGCEPLEGRGRTGLTALRVTPGAVAAAPACGTAPGLVERYQVSLDGQESRLGCDEAVTFAPLVPEQVYRVRVLGFEAGATAASWGTSCHGVASAGVTRDVICDAMTTLGALELDVPSLLASEGLACGGGGIASLEAVLEPGAVRLSQYAPACGVPLVFDRLTPGAYVLSVTTTLADGQAGPSITCTGEVLPGAVTTATCGGG